VRYPPEQRLDLPTSPSLLSRLRNRDAEGWRMFLALYTPLVVRWCKRQRLNLDDTADIAQDVFQKVSAHIDEFRKESATDSFSAWLCRVTHNAIVDLARRNQVTVKGGTDTLMRLNAVAPRAVVEPDEQDCNAETRYLYEEAMKAAQREFSDRMWRMFWRVVVDGNPAQAVAQEFDTTPAAIRQAKSRVLRRLKQLVGDLAD
jgi:RNA polymerase sigma-70 factor (ECF subfamily)